MKLLSEKTILDAFSQLQLIPAYSEVLTFQGVPEGTGHKLFQSLMDHPKLITGKAPNEFQNMKNVVNIPSPLSSLNGRQLCRLYQFLNNNGQYRLLPTPEDGDCFYGAFRRGTNLPYDVADVHIRRLILKAICNNHEFFFNLYKCSIAQTYGCDRDPEEELARRKADAQYLREQRMPGPFSFMTYLRYMLKNSSYADIHIMMTASMMWNLRITILYAESCMETRIRHHKRIAQADMVLVLCQDTKHIVSAGKIFRSGYTIFVRSRRKLFFGKTCVFIF